MPELPEVETTRRGIEPHILNVVIQGATIRQPMLRWPIPDDLPRYLLGQSFISVDRRGKYLLLRTGRGTLIVHLGMSGSLRLEADASRLRKHDHVDIVFANGLCLRFHDPRRFGCMLWTSESPYDHALIASLGPEPLSECFNRDYLYGLAKRRNTAIKTMLMNSQIVVGIGNIYANEALFLSGIDPRRSANRISSKRMGGLCSAVKSVLNRSIAQGGTTLRDFVNGKGQPGYFQQSLHVYNRSGLKCPSCRTLIRRCKLGQRSTFFCPNCQR